jgi:subtilisin family serine protease
MTSQRQWRRLAVGMAFTTAIAGATLVASSTAMAQPNPDGSVSIGAHDEELLEQAKQRGDKTVQVLVATEEGAEAKGVAELVKAGGTVRYREDAVNYVRVEIAVDKVKRLASLPGIDAVDVDEKILLDDPKPDGQNNPTPQTPPNAGTPRVNDFMPTGDTGAAQFVDAHPEWDGRGVTVGVLDTGIDLDHPSLNTTSTGERKIVDWVTATNPAFSGTTNLDQDPTWILTNASLPADYMAPPGAGTLSFGVFNERDPRFGDEMGNDANRDGNPAGSNGLFGVAWDKASNTVWVDTNQNKNFGDDKAMTDFKVRNDVNKFGTDNPATAVKEALPFVVQTSPSTNSVNIGVVSGAHGSHVAGIIAGNSLFGGQMSGAAPGAKLVSVRACMFLASAGCTARALVEGMIFAARDANVDVINMSIGGLPALNDANNARAKLYTELIDTYDVQMFISAGNSGNGVNTIGDPAVADKVVAVGSYISKASWRRNYGSDAAAEDNMHPFSSRGPREDGGFKPTLIAPGSATSTVPTWQGGQPVAGAMDLPPGYGMFNGTSMASPQAAGAAALLVSAAQARGVQHLPEQLRQALNSSARFVPGYQAYEQGNGLLKVDRAWDLLQANIAVTDITSSVPVNTVLSPLLAKANVGVGIHDREGVKSGDNYSRDYTFVRNSGPATPVTYKVSWVGNDGTFSSPTSITLRKGFAVKFRVHINPRSAGVHSAILNLDSPLTTGIEYQTLNTVVAAEDFTSQNGFTVAHGGTINRNTATSYFVRVNPNTPALKVDLQGGGTTPGAGQIRFTRVHPFGVGIDSNSSLSCYNPQVNPGGSCAGGSPSSRVVVNPQPGVWEITVEARRTSDVAAAPYTLSASVLGATISPNPDTIAQVAPGTPVNRSYSLSNVFGPFTGRAVGTTLGSAKIDTPTIADLAQQQFPIVVTAGSSQLRVKIGSTSDPGADLDLFLFNCTTGTCVLAGQSADGDSEEEVTIGAPAAGTWIALVDGFAVPAGTTSYKYLDVFTNSAFGSVAINDANAARAAGATWSVSGTVTANAAPAAGRVLLGNVQVRTDTNVLIGSSDVIVQKVG